jgi:tetratricopeptide (TPR) repeat protein
MPRPPKHVSPDTLGGRIREARKGLNLSLEHVAGGQYSTSLISQIERNRVEPSQRSLEFLATQLHLPIEDLMLLAQQQKETETEAHQYRVFEELRIEASQALANKQPYQALDTLKTLHIQQVPLSLRWRLAALRGQCYFALRQFLPAQKDFVHAVAEKPDNVPMDQRLEIMTLHLYLAAALRELVQPEAAFEQYQIALDMMDTSTSLHHIADAHWGMSLIAYERAMLSDCEHYKEEQLSVALKHAENASVLYRSIGQKLRASLLTCQIGLIEQALGRMDEARTHLLEVLDKWRPELEIHTQIPPLPAEQRTVQEVANVVSVVACTLAGIELEAHNYPQALTYVQQAKSAGKLSYILRRAEAEMMLGRILQEIDLHDPAVEKAFRAALKELGATDRIAARIRAHDLLGRHLLRRGEVKVGEKELDQGQRLSHLATAFSSATIFSNGDQEDISQLG